MDQYSPAIVTVPTNVLSVEFPYNGTSIVANREYNITVSAINDQGISCSSDPVVVGKCSYKYMCIFCDLASENQSYVFTPIHITNIHIYPFYCSYVCMCRGENKFSNVGRYQLYG